MSLRPVLDPEELLAHVGWVRSLALQVARDPHAADDLAQETFLVALSKESERPRSPRHWLAAVVRNLSRTSGRSERRRLQREAAVGPAQSAPSTLELVERAATQRALVGALLELDEPYRSTLLQRFFEGRSPRAIAERTGLPESTVATRTAEGLRRLRRKLAREGEGSWLPSLLPLLRWPKEGPSFAGAITGAVAMSIQAKIVLGAALLVSALLVWVALDAPRSPAVEPLGRATAPEQEPALVAAPPDRKGRTAPLQAPVTLPPPVDARAPMAGAEDVGANVVRGRVIDLRGEPVEGVEVCSVGSRWPADEHHAGLPQGGTACATSDADGAFSIELDPPSRIAARSEPYVTVFEGVVGPEARSRPIVIVARRMPLGGLVVDEDGRGVAEATVTLHFMDLPLQYPGVSLEASRVIIPQARCDAAGAFVFPDAPETDSGRLEVRAAGLLPALVPVPPGGDDELRIVLTRPRSGSEAIVGRVVHPDHSPASNARVSAGWYSVPTDAEGWFVLDLEHALHHVERDEALTLSAASDGLLPATLALPSLAEAEAAGWPEDIVLRLGGPPLTIRGRVVDEAGNGLRGVSVAAADVTTFGLVPGPTPGGFLMRTLEDIAGGGITLTDADGGFELLGLLDRSYRIEAMHPVSLLSTLTQPVAAGSVGVRVVLDRRVLGRIAGRIVDRTGRGVAGVRVSVSRHWPGQLAIGDGDTTDEEGRFALDGVTTEPSFLRLVGDAIVPDLFRALEPDADLAALELVVGRKCHLQIDWGDWAGRADELSVLDSRELPLDLMRLTGGSISHPAQSLPVGTGLSDVYAVSDAAAHAVLSLGGEELTRFRVHPVPGEVELLEL